MQLAIEYILCYSTAFLLGAFVGGTVVGYINNRRHHKQMIIDQRLKHIRRDNNRRRYG